MKTTRQSILLFVAAVLPLALNAQTASAANSTANSSDPTASSSHHYSGTAASDPATTTSSDSSRSGSNGITNRSGVATPSDSQSTLSGMSNSNMLGGQAMQTVTKESLENQFTAKNLIGKDVYDRDQKKIGDVMDVVLPGQSASLESAFAQDSDSSKHRSMDANDGANASSPNRSASDSNYSSTRTDSTVHGNQGSQAGSTSRSSSAMGSDSSQVAVVISHGSMWTMNRDLIRVPLSQLRYDSSSKHFMLNVSSSDITGLASTDTASR